MTISTIDKLRRRLPRAMADERARSGRELARLRRQAAAETAVPETRLAVIAERLAASAAQKARRRAAMPVPAYDPALPITAHREAIVEAIRRHPVVIVSGETGSGKTTQLPKFCLEAGRGLDGLIGCTQPRRIAALTVARRIAEELGQPLGRAVGHKIRFSDRTGPEAFIKVMTDGILLAEAQRDRSLTSYDTLIVDEAHERSLNIDFALGLLRTLVRRRRDLRLIVTSATIDTQKFAAAFDGAPVIEVSGRTYPVTVRWAPIDNGSGEEALTYVEAAAAAVDRIRRRGPWGDVLVFMPSEQDIRDTVELIEARRRPGETVLPLFARLPAADQLKVFAPAGGRKIIVATNVAETSITIPGIRYVVDTGLARISRYSPRTRTTALPVAPISQASCDQRAGRSGRVADGICIRLYSQEDYDSRPRFTAPEILRANLAEVVLRMIALRLGDIADFPFIDRPADKSIRDGILLLEELGAVEAAQAPAAAHAAIGSRHLHLTAIGRQMARMPLDPRLARMLIEARRRGCTEPIIVIAAALSIADVRERPAEKAAAADQAHAVFVDPGSDFATLVQIWRAYQTALETEKSAGRLRRWAQRCFLSHRRLREWRDIHGQLAAIMAELEADGGLDAPGADPLDASALQAAVHQSILAGFLGHIGQRREKNRYQATRGREVMIFPGSGVFNRAGAWIVAAEIVETSRLFARTVATVQPEWIEAAAGSLCRSTYLDPRWERRRGEVVADEQVCLFGLVLVARRPVSYGRIDPQAASEIFIRSALVDGDLRQPLPFMVHNRELMDGLRAEEDKMRRRDILVSPEDVFQFYCQRLPAIGDLRALKHHLKTKGDGHLRMDEADLRRYHPSPEELAAFPDQVRLGATPLACTYRFDPGSREDGVTVKIPSALAAAVPPQALDWLVPGLLGEKIEALIRGLPKAYRRRLVPVARTVAAILQDLPSRRDEPLLTVLGRIIQRRFGLEVPAAAWPLETLPDHLRTRIAVTGPDGREIAADRDPSVLRRAPAPAPDLRPLERLRRRWERPAVQDWDFGDLPNAIPVAMPAEPCWVVYPALVCEPEGRIALRLLQDAAAAQAAHRKAVAALFTRRLGPDLRRLSRHLTLPPEKRRLADYFGGPTILAETLFDRLVETHLARDIRTAADFEAQAARLAGDLFPAGQGLLTRTLAVAEAVHAARQTIFGLEQQFGANPVVTAFFEARRRDLSRLVPAHFVLLYDDARLDHLPRYIRALAVRAERATLDFEKDRRKAEAAAPFETRLDAWLAGLGPTASAAKRQAVEDYFWLLEEFKVSLFAQELGTAAPVSAKRLDNLAAEIERSA